jgi:4-amino-4-deoxy-L-arabinose transferase-like glycosyltransferase
MSEMLAQVGIVTAALLLERYFRTEKAAYIVGFGVLSAVLILIRPIFIYMPAMLLLLVALWAWRIGKLTLLWRGVAASFALTYLVVIGFQFHNLQRYGFFSLSDASNVNPFGKVLEYHMQLETSDPRYQHLAADANAYVQSGQSDPWEFVARFPQYNGHYYLLLGTYSEDIILHHPVEFVAKTIPDIVETLDPPITVYAPYSARPWWVAILLGLSAAEMATYLFLPILLIVMFIWFWNAPERRSLAVICALLLLLAGDVVTAAALDYNSFFRLRMPLDWAMILVTCVVSIELAAGPLHRYGTAMRHPRRTWLPMAASR